MKVEQESAISRRIVPIGPRSSITDTTSDWTKVETVLDVVSRLPESPARFVARAPFPLDVMGGLADYSGALALHLPLGDYVCAAVQSRDDGHFVVERCSGFSSNGRAPMSVSIDEVTASIESDSIESLASRLPEDDGVVERCAVGVACELVRAGLVPPEKIGMTVAVGCTAELGRCSAGPICAAVLAAVSRAFDLEIEPAAGAQHCQAVEHRWFDIPAGVSVAAGALTGECASVGEHRCDANALGGRTRLPDGVTMIGLSTGKLHPDFVAKYSRVRCATFMGRYLIDRIVNHDGAGNLRWDGHLSRVSVTDYVERFRDRIPTRLKGNDFLSRFGETGDPLTKVEPGFVYKIRSRTEHHVYEHSRSRQFVEGLARYARSGDRTILGEVGELMYASHWSYGQRCGLGSIETDLLVNLVKRYGSSAGIHGARISGRGCGGMVAVLMDDSPAADQAVQQACQAYEEKTGQLPTIMRGSLPGAMVAGARAV